MYGDISDNMSDWLPTATDAHQTIFFIPGHGHWTLKNIEKVKKKHRKKQKNSEHRQTDKNNA